MPTRSSKHGALGPNRSPRIVADLDRRHDNTRERRVAPRVEPSTEGAKQWTGGRRQKRKHR